MSCLAEEIATPGDGQIKALITVAGNPVQSSPAGDKLDDVLPQLDAMISIDCWINETTRHADVILPGQSPLAQPHHDDLILAFAVNSVANYSAPVFAPDDPGRPEEWEILIRLTGLCTGTPAEAVDVGAIDDGFFDYVAFTQGLDGAAVRNHYQSAGPAGGPERILDLTLRTGPFGDRYGENPDGLTLEKLKKRPNGINFGPMIPQLPDILGTPERKIRLTPQYLLDDLPKLAQRIKREHDELVLVSGRHHVRNELQIGAPTRAARSTFPDREQGGGYGDQRYGSGGDRRCRWPRWCDCPYPARPRRSPHPYRQTGGSPQVSGVAVKWCRNPRLRSGGRGRSPSSPPAWPTPTLWSQTRRYPRPGSLMTSRRGS